MYVPQIFSSHRIFSKCRFPINWKYSVAPFPSNVFYYHYPLWEIRRNHLWDWENCEKIFLKQLRVSASLASPFSFNYEKLCIQLSFVQYSLLCYEVFILSKAKCKIIYYHFRRDRESNGFRKLARNKWICRETCDFFLSWSIYLIIHQFSCNHLISFNPSVLI